MEIRGGNILQTDHLYNDVTDPIKCQTLCQHHLECNYFVLNVKTKQCMLKTSDMSKSFKKGNVVGPKYCGKVMHVY